MVATTITARGVNTAVQLGPGSSSLRDENRRAMRVTPKTQQHRDRKTQTQIPPIAMLQGQQYGPSPSAAIAASNGSG